MLISALEKRNAGCCGSQEKGHPQVAARSRVGRKVSGRVETWAELLKWGVGGRSFPGGPRGDGWWEAGRRLEAQIRE